VFVEEEGKEKEKSKRKRKKEQEEQEKQNNKKKPTIMALAPTKTDLDELRAAQRTFEGAYVRTALSQFSFALVVLKIFTAEFYSIGALFAVYGVGVLVVGSYRRRQGMKVIWLDGRQEGDGEVDREGERRRGGSAGDRGDVNDGGRGGDGRNGDGTATAVAPKRFQSSGNVVLALTVLSVLAYTILVVLTLRLGRSK
jgi:hypothetical protein